MTETRNVSDIAKEDVRGKASEAESQWLRGEGILRFREELILLKRDIESQFVDRKADLDIFHCECRRLGEKGKQEYFEEKSEYESWRASAVKFKAKVEAKISEVKRLIRDEATSDNDYSGESHDALFRRGVSALERIATALEDENNDEA